MKWVSEKPFGRKHYIMTSWKVFTKWAETVRKVKTSRYRHYYYDRCNRRFSRGLDGRQFDSCCSSQSCTINEIFCLQNWPSSLTRALGISTACVDFSRLRRQANTGCYEIRNWRTLYKDGQTYMLGFFISIPFKNDGRFVSIYQNHGQIPWFSRKLDPLDIFWPSRVRSQF